MNAPFALACLACILSTTVAARPVSICDDDAEFPPYSYREKSGENPAETRYAGATVELIAEVFRLIKMDYSFKMIPWKRCTTEVENYKGGDGYEVFVNGSYSEDRARKYHMTAPIFRTREGLWYSKKKFSKGPPIARVEDLTRFRVCGVNGYNYEWLRSHGVKNVDTGAAHPRAVLQKIALDRCDFYVAGLEDIYGSERIGRFSIPAEVAGIPFPGGRRPSYHFFIARSSPRAHELYTNINRAILLLQSRGIARNIYKKYLPEGDGL